jgi:hypothetical protein
MVVFNPPGREPTTLLRGRMGVVKTRWISMTGAHTIFLRRSYDFVGP